MVVEEVVNAGANSDIFVLLTVLLVIVFCVLLGVLIYMMTRDDDDDDDDDDYNYYGDGYRYNLVSASTGVNYRTKEVDPNDLR